MAADPVVRNAALETLNASTVEATSHAGFEFELKVRQVRNMRPAKERIRGNAREIRGRE